MVLVQKSPFFQLFFVLSNMDQENVFYDILEWKNAFLGSAIKTRSLKSPKIYIFLNGLTHGFRPKMTIFTTFFFFCKIDQENVFYDILKQKNALLGYKNKKFKKSKKSHFSKGVNPCFWSKNGHFFNIFFR